LEIVGAPIDRRGRRATRHGVPKVVNLTEARAHLPELIERAARGEEIVLAKAGKPRARLVPLADEKQSLREPGKGKGRFRAKRGFDVPLSDDVVQLFEGDA
jgi:prevent-host-death family protein